MVPSLGEHALKAGVALRNEVVLRAVPPGQNGVDGSKVRGQPVLGRGSRGGPGNRLFNADKVRDMDNAVRVQAMGSGPRARAMGNGARVRVKAMDNGVRDKVKDMNSAVHRALMERGIRTEDMRNAPGPDRANHVQQDLDAANGRARGKAEEHMDRAKVKARVTDELKADTVNREDKVMGNRVVARAAVMARDDRNARAHRASRAELTGLANMAPDRVPNHARRGNLQSIRRTFRNDPPRAGVTINLARAVMKDRTDLADHADPSMTIRLEIGN
jgi:hypothetical protein